MPALSYSGSAPGGATPLISGAQADRIRQRTRSATALNMNFLVAERSAYMFLAPVVGVALIYLNAQLAWDYMVRDGGASGPDDVLAYGYSAAQLINGFVGVALILCGSIIAAGMAFDEEKGIGAWASRRFCWGVFACVTVFSVWTAWSELATGQQELFNRSAAGSTASVIAGDVSDTAAEAVRGAQADLAAARRDLSDAKARADGSRASWATYQANNADNDPWLLNTTHSQGPGRPFIAEIDRADAAVKAARGRIETARAALDAARGMATQAQAARLDALNGGGAESTVITTFGASVPAWLGGPWTPEQIIAARGLLIAILLDIVRYALLTASGRALKSALHGQSAARDDELAALGDAVRQPAPRPTAAPVDRAPPSTPVDRSPFPGPVVAPAVHDSDDDTTDNDANITRRYATVIADIIADARRGVLTSASFGHLKKNYDIGADAAGAARKRLLENDLAYETEGGHLKLFGHAV